MLGLFAFAAASSINLECPLPSSTGEPILWQISLNEGEGTADVIVGPIDPVRTKAIFTADSVRFYLKFPVPADIAEYQSRGPGMRVDISRTDLKIARYSNGNDAPPEYGQCRMANVKPKAF